ncbi:MAG TPA: tRNA (adenosine(37)-N6)-threonylcarbamoyltransferase complex dimerization subunit type 1 TsaB [Pyrinomonadaceae bacterium]|nr:tRNA (adenosine(37)-N6)-threonylcarbamoyltransferase complex dimerization subunit type 1 TsaB [Pyrinomonadaceae bacterium]
MSEPVILSLETATLAGSVWLGCGDVELTSRTGDPDVSQSTSLLNDIHEILSEAGVKLVDVDLFCCANGPGSFTGLRIGIATLKGLAAPLKKACVGIPTLAAVAHAGGPGDAIVALLPAGRGEVFVQLFSVSADGKVKELDSAAHLSPARMLERYAGMKKLKWAGPGAILHRGLIEQHAREVVIPFSDGTEPLPEAAEHQLWELIAVEPNLARHVALLALQAHAANKIQSPGSLSAIYVRPSDAELNQKCQ